MQILQLQMHSAETEQMIEKLQQEAAVYEDYAHTGSGILDVMVKEKAASAREKTLIFPSPRI